MRTVEIGGKKFELRNADEVTYGAEKELERVQFEASLVMLSDGQVAELATKARSGDGKVDGEEFMKRVMSGEIKKSLLDSHEAAITPEEEAIILSAGIRREDLLKLPGKVVRELAKEAQEELGTAEDFSEASTSDTS
jgi:hypothetical protein